LQGGNLKDVKVLSKVLVSKDIEAADAYATKLFNLNPQNVSPSIAARKRGLDEIVLYDILIVLSLKSDIT
jgi:uncharacterized protein (DUF362 family)